MGYDSAGNLAWNKDGKANQYSYSYDYLNRRTEMKYPPDNSGVQRTEQYTYDAAGNLQVCRACYPPPPCDCAIGIDPNMSMASTGNSFSSDGETANTASNGPAPIAVYLYAGDQIIENVTMGYFYYQDSLGNTSHVTDAVGNLLERYTYSAFGTPTFLSANDTQLSTSAYGIKHLFQGQLWTQETGLNDYRNRVELPVMGVFLQPDPIGFKGDAANIYRFCNNNGLNRIDPLGLYWDFLPDQYPRNFDNIKDIPETSKRSNGYTARPVFSAVASIVPSGDGYGIKYYDVNIKSQSYIRTHQRHGDFWKPPQEDRLIADDLVRTTFHEGRQKRIDHGIYKKWHNDGTFKRIIEGGKTYSSQESAREGLRQNAQTARNEFEGARREQGKRLQQQDGMYQPNHFDPSPAPSAADVDRAHPPGGVPSQGVEAQNHVNGKL